MIAVLKVVGKKLDQLRMMWALGRKQADHLQSSERFVAQMIADVIFVFAC